MKRCYVFSSFPSIYLNSVYKNALHNMHYITISFSLSVNYTYLNKHILFLATLCIFNMRYCWRNSFVYFSKNSWYNNKKVKVFPNEFRNLNRVVSYYFSAVWVKIKQIYEDGSIFTDDTRFSHCERTFIKMHQVKIHINSISFSVFYSIGLLLLILFFMNTFDIRDHNYWIINYIYYNNWTQYCKYFLNKYLCT